MFEVLSHQIDHLHEAQVFLDPYFEFCDVKPVIVVFGGASGSHLHVLRKKYPSKQIFLFEVDFQRVEIIRSLYPSISFTHVVSVDEQLQNAICQGAVLIRHRPSWVGRENIFEQAWLQCKGPQILNHAAAILAGPRPFQLEDRLWLCLRELFK